MGLEPLIILLVDVTVKSHSGYAYMGLVPRAQGFGLKVEGAGVYDGVEIACSATPCDGA